MNSQLRLIAKVSSKQYDHEEPKIHLNENNSFSTLGSNGWEYKSPSQIFLSQTIEDYKNWLAIPSCLVLFNKKTNFTFFRTVAKRGNSEYARIVRNKVDEKTAFMHRDNFNENFMLRDKKGFRSKGNYRISNALFLTLTFNPDLFGKDFTRSWEEENKYYNRFMTAFKKRYGKAWVLKAVESHKNGFCHLHILLVCENPFNAFLHNKTYRIQEKNEINDLWFNIQQKGSKVALKHSITDISVPTSVNAVKSYITKDMLKSLSRRNRTEQDIQTLALNWKFRKHSFSISDPTRLFGDSLSLSSSSITQTQIEEITGSKDNKDIIFLGIATLSSIPPPDERFKLTKHELKQILKSSYSEKIINSLDID